MTVNSGDMFHWERTFTDEEVLHFGKITGDQGIHHVEHDDQGRLMVHGLLTASIGTKIGGDLNYIARKMTSEFIRPVFTGDTVRCEMNILNVTQHDKFSMVEVKSVYRNQHGKDVLLAASQGIIRD